MALFAVGFCILFLICLSNQVLFAVSASKVFRVKFLVQKGNTFAGKNRFFAFSAQHTHSFIVMLFTIRNSVITSKKLSIFERSLASATNKVFWVPFFVYCVDALTNDHLPTCSTFGCKAVHEIFRTIGIAVFTFFYPRAIREIFSTNMTTKAIGMP